MINQPYEGATPEQLRNPFVRELLGVHNMFRNQLAAILAYVEELIAGDQQLTAPATTAQIQALIRSGAQYTQILHTHHHLETSYLFPPLQEEGLESEVVDRLNAEHDEIGVLVDKFNDAIHQLATIEPGVLDNDLRRLADALHAHLAYEETHVCPFMARWRHLPPMH